MEDLSTSSSPPNRRRLLVVCFLFFLCVLLLSLIPAAFWGKKAVRQWQFEKTLKSAEAAFKSNDLRSAILGAKQALNIRPNAVKPLRIMVDIAERFSNPEVILWQQQLSEARGNPPEELLRLAGLALQFDETFVAGDALSKVPEANRKSPAFQQASAALAAKEGRLPAAEEHLKAALAQQHENAALQVKLAEIQLAIGGAATVEKAYETLNRFATDPRWRISVLRTLVNDARRKAQHERAHALAKQLAVIPSAPLSDKLLAVETLRPIDEKAFQAKVAELKDQSSHAAGPAFDLMRWMNAQGLAAETVSWSSTLPDAIKAQMPVPLAIAEALDKTKQWRKLSQIVLRPEEWGGLEFLRRAYRARVSVADTGRFQSENFKFEWDRAVQASTNSLGNMWILAQLAHGWGWKPQAAQVWWMLANRPAGQRQALKELFKLYKEDGDTANLFEVVKRVAEIEPANPIAKNNKAMMSFLADRDLDEAHKTAAELYQSYPSEPAVSSTYAFSQLKKGNTKEAQAILERLPANARNTMPLSFYYAVILAANGRIDEARPILDEALKDPNLLPEEKKLAESFAGKSPLSDQ